MKRLLHNIMVTGGAGFVGANFIHYLFERADFSGKIVNVDSLSYAANLKSLLPIEAKFGVTALPHAPRYVFAHNDICDRFAIDNLLRKHNIDTIVHFAAESHVDRSILNPEPFIKANIYGTFTLLDVARNFWTEVSAENTKKMRSDVVFHHVSTDEVYGSIDGNKHFTETTAYNPQNPYSATKASSDHLVKAYNHTYGLPVTLSNCSNNYGPYQLPEKFIPLMISNMQAGKKLPLYGDGKNIRDWLYVKDHNNAVWTILQHGRIGETYNIGGENEWENIKLLNKLIEIVSAKLLIPAEKIRSTITYVTDRPGHDRRYSIDCSKLKRELGWKPQYTFDEGLLQTVTWYLDNPHWWAPHW